jgi:hypothetical protein
LPWLGIDLVKRFQETAPIGRTIASGFLSALVGLRLAVGRDQEERNLCRG